MPVTDLDTRRGGRKSRAEQRRETRQKLYEAAVEEFRRVGFAHAQIDHIVEKAGVARGTFYFHFPTKEHVLFERQRLGESGIVERFEAALRERPETVKGFLRLIVDAIFSETESVGDAALAREIMAVYVRQGRLVDTSSMPLIVAMADFFSDAAERGDVRDDIAPEEIGVLFLMSLFWFIVGHLESRDQSPVLDDWIDIFSRGIAP